MLAGTNSFSFRVSLKDYKQGLSHSKYSLLLNQFFINSMNFINEINEILINNFPFQYFDLFFKDYLDDTKLKFQFKIFISKLGSQINTTSHFVIFPKVCLYLI